MTRELKIALVGCGRVAQHYTKIIKQIKNINIKIIAVCDTKKIRAITPSISFILFDWLIPSLKAITISDSKKAEINIKINNDKSIKISLLNIIFKFILS